MALTVKEVEQHIDHYNVYRELPVEVMQELFAAALTVATLTNPELAAEELKEVVVEAKKPRAKKSEVQA